MKRNLIVLSVFSLIWGASLGCEEDLKLGDVADPELADSDDSTTPEDVSPTLSNNACPTHYKVFTLGPLHNGDFAMALDINDDGWIVGSSHTYIDFMDGSLGFIWKPEVTGSGEDTELHLGELVEFHNVEGAQSGFGTPRQINNDGQILGTTWVADPQGHGSWSRPATWTEEPGSEVLIWDPEDEHIEGHFGAVAINNSGVVAGEYYTVDGGGFDWKTGYYWTAEDGFTALPVPEGAQETGHMSVVDINDNGQILGQATMVGYLQSAAFIWSPSDGYKLLKSYGPLGYERIFPTKMNNKGQVVGKAQTYVNGEMSYMHPIVWDEYGYAQDLGILPYPETLRYGEATDINDDGLIVGDDDGEGYGDAWVFCEGAKRRITDMLENIEANADIEIFWIGGLNNDGWMAANGLGGPFLLYPYFEEIDAQ